MKTWSLLLLAVGLAAGCGKSPDAPARPGAGGELPPPAPSGTSASSPWFTNVVAGSGLTFQHRSGQTGRYWLPEMETGGVGLLDYDGDGLLDVFCVSGGTLDPAHPGPPGHRLYRNLGNWKFADVTAAAGLECPDGYGMGCAVGDYDGDGRPDLYVTQLGSNHLYHNLGDGRFADVTTTAGVAVGAWSTSAAFVDYDGDGWLDLVVVNYVKWSPAVEMECFSAGGRRDYCSPKNYHAPTPTVLLHNRGNGTFEDVTQAAGLDRVYGNGLGLATGDFDHDGRVDFFVANDATPNQLWLNQGKGRFVDEGPLRGCALNSMGVPRAGMGVVAVDLFQRGWLDLFVSHLVGEGNGLFWNQKGIFLDSLTPEGPMAGSLPFTGFGVALSDFDNDGKLDLYVANGRVRLGPEPWSAIDPYAEPNTLRRGMGAGRFAEVRPVGGTMEPLVATSRGLAVGDLDNDGAPDVVVVNRDGPVHLLRNLTGNSGRWVQFALTGRDGRDVRNAVLRLETADGVQWREHQPNQGYCSSQDPRVHFGLGAKGTGGQLWVRWSDGSAEDFGVLAAGKIHPIRAGTGRPAPGKFDW